MNQLKDHHENMPQKVGMLIPPPILLVLLGTFAASLHFIKWGHFSLSFERSLIGVAFISLGIALITLCVRYFRQQKTPIRPDKTPTIAIVAKGPYAYSRNPMYVGMALLLIGLAIMLKSPAFLFATVLFVIIIHFGVVLREERYLLCTQHEAYTSYLQQVRRWL